jgi:archaellum component FlaC
MAFMTRTMNLGRKSELEQQAMKLKVEIDSQVKAMLVHFEPLDQDLQYVQNIMPERLKIYVDSIARKVKELKKVLEELKSVINELGE